MPPPVALSSYMPIGMSGRPEDTPMPMPMPTVALSSYIANRDCATPQSPCQSDVATPESRARATCRRVLRRGRPPHAGAWADEAEAGDASDAKADRNVGFKPMLHACARSSALLQFVPMAAGLDAAPFPGSAWTPVQ